MRDEAIQGTKPDVPTNSILYMFLHLLSIPLASLHALIIILLSVEYF